MEDHLHPSMITLAKDPFKTIAISDHCRPKVCCAKLVIQPGDDGFSRESYDEDERLKKEATSHNFKKKDAYQHHCKRIHSQFAQSDYGVCDLSSLHHEKGVRAYHKQLTKQAQLLYHVVEPCRSKF